MSPSTLRTHVRCSSLRGPTTVVKVSHGVNAPPQLPRTSYVISSPHTVGRQKGSQNVT